jgi:hypothetical protein
MSPKVGLKTSLTKLTFGMTSSCYILMDIPNDLVRYSLKKTFGPNCGSSSNNEILYFQINDK